MLDPDRPPAQRVAETQAKLCPPAKRFYSLRGHHWFRSAADGENRAMCLANDFVRGRRRQVAGEIRRAPHAQRNQFGLAIDRNLEDAVGRRAEFHQEFRLAPQKWR